MQTDFIGIIKTLHFASIVWLLFLPTAMMGIDIITGLLGAWVAKDFQSAKMRSGLAKKCGELLIILIGLLFTFGMELPDYILNFVVLYIIIMELMSVIENTEKLGAPWPQAIKDVINNVGTAVQTDDYKELMGKLRESEKVIEASKATIAAMEAEQETRIKEKNHEQQE